MKNPKVNVFNNRANFKGTKPSAGYISIVMLSFCFPSDCWIFNLKASGLYVSVKSRLCADFTLLTHRSILFHPTSSSSLKHKRKDERKHKKRSVCACCIRIMYFPNLTQLFDPPPIRLLHFHLLLLRPHGKPSRP